MANTIVSLFDKMTDAQKLTRELTEAGFSSGKVNTVTSSSGGDVTSTLKQASVPDDAARMYADGVRDGKTLVTLDVEDNEIERAMAIIERYETVDINESATGSSAGRTTRTDANRTTTEGDVAIPVIEEEIQIGKRQVQRGGIRVYNRVTERPVEETVTLREEHINVERRPVNRAVTDADTATLREGSFEVSTTSEEAVISKQARVVEEVIVNKDVTERAETVRDTVRRTEVEVDETGTDETTRAKGTTGR